MREPPCFRCGRRRYRERADGSLVCARCWPAALDAARPWPAAQNRTVSGGWAGLSQPSPRADHTQKTAEEVAPMMILNGIHYASIAEYEASVRRTLANHARSSPERTAPRRPVVQFKSRHRETRSDGWDGHTYAFKYVAPGLVPPDTGIIGQSVVSATADALHVPYPQIRWFRPAHPGERGDFREVKTVTGVYDPSTPNVVLLDATLSEVETAATAAHETQHNADHQRGRPLTEVAADSLGARIRDAFSAVWS